MPTGITWDAPRSPIRSTGFIPGLSRQHYNGASTIILESVRGPEYHIQEIAGCLSEVLIDCDLRNAHTDKSNTTIIQYFFSKIKPLAFY